MTPRSEMSLPGDKRRKLENPQEWNFFPSGKIRDDTEVRVILDYEQARESTQVISWLLRKSAQEREICAKRCVRSGMRYAWQTIAEPELYIPTVCLVAENFPAPWLNLSEGEQRTIVNRFACMYRIKPLPSISYPTQGEEGLLFHRAAQEDGISLQIFAINRKLTKTRLMEQFQAWLLAQDDIAGELSSQGKVKWKTKLTDLACWRLMQIAVGKRDFLVDSYQLKPGAREQISRAAARAKSRLHNLGYSLKVTF